jgi:hypothetical protein
MIFELKNRVGRVLRSFKTQQCEPDKRLTKVLQKHTLSKNQQTPGTALVLDRDFRSPRQNCQSFALSRREQQLGRAALFAPSREEFRKHSPTFRAEYPAYNFSPVIKSGVVQDLVQRSRRPSFGIGRAINDARDSRQHYSPGTHRAGLERYVQRAMLESPIAQRIRRLRNREHFGVRGRIVKLFTLIVRRPDYPVVAPEWIMPYDDSADWHFVLGASGLGLAQRLPHVMLVRQFEFGKLIHFNSIACNRSLQPVQLAPKVSSYVDANNQQRRF